jgi:hypothetical protein
MLTYVPAAIALVLAFDLLTVLFLGSVGSRRRSLVKTHHER